MSRPASRARPGKRSGPSTISPTTASTSSSIGPMLNTLRSLIRTERDRRGVFGGSAVVDDGDLVAGLVVLHDHDQIVVAGRGLVTRGNDNIAGLEPGLRGRPAVLYLLEIGT